MYEGIMEIETMTDVQQEKKRKKVKIQNNIHQIYSHVASIFCHPCQCERLYIF